MSINSIIQERVKPAILGQQIEMIERDEELVKAFNATNVIILIVNSSNQVVFANQSSYEFLQSTNKQEILGRRPGEVFRCIHSDKEIGGCGTSAYCMECTALGIIKKSIGAGTAVSGEAVITQRLDKSEFPLNVYEHVRPIEIKNYTYFVISLIDISDRIKRQFLERIFFHDILNSVGALRGLLMLLEEDAQAGCRQDVELVRVYFDNVIEEIQSQKQLLEAESRELQVDWKPLHSLEVLQTVRDIYARLEEYKDYAVIIDPDSVSIQFNSDLVLLRRVISNMLKNALEACQPQEQVVLGVRRGPDQNKITFWVGNKAYMPDEIQKRVFERSFSTKGKGRGLGTYSIKLLGEKYLKGKVFFSSSRSEGTVFYLELPDNPTVSNYR